MRTTIINQHRPVLQIFAKVPEKGKVKTRLATQTSADYALAVAKASLIHLCQKATNDWQGDVELWLGNFDTNHCPSFISQIIDSNPRLTIFPQCQGNLGDRMFFAMEHSLQNNQQAVIIGSDIPHISQSILSQAYQLALQKKSFIGPCLDGGYYMISSQSPNKSMFLNVDWGSENSYQQTCTAWNNVSPEPPIILENFFDIDYHQDVLNAIEYDAPLGIEINKLLNT